MNATGKLIYMQYSFSLSLSLSLSIYIYIYGLFGWLFVLFYGVSTLFWSFNAELSHFDQSLKQFILEWAYFKMSKQF